MTAMVSVDNLTKRFGGKLVLEQVNWMVPEGTIYGLVGSNGAGKTTFFNCISGQLRPDAGHVLLDGKEMTGAPPYEMAEQGLARTFQNLELFSDLTVLQNVLVGRHLRMTAGPLASMVRLPRERSDERRARKAAMEALDRVGLSDRATRLVGELPYGEQRLVEVARALALAPSVLLLDEPAAGLNLTEKQALGQLLGRLRGLGVTLLLIEHDMDLVEQVADRITVLNFGKRIADGTPAEVLRHPEVVAAYLGEEAGHEFA